MATQRSGTLFTYEDYCNFPEDERYEIIDGELIVVAAPLRVHQGTSRNISTPLDTFVKANQLGEMYYAPNRCNPVEHKCSTAGHPVRQQRAFTHTGRRRHQRCAGLGDRGTVAIHCTGSTRSASVNSTRVSASRNTGRWTQTI